MKVLLCGNNSFAASGLCEKLVSAGLQVDCFSRGEEKRIENKVTGDVFQIFNNKYLDEDYHTVINFIIIKNKSIEENLLYIKALDRFCRERKVKNFIQISSISVYSNDLLYVNEESEIEDNPYNKGKYGSIKVAIDQYFLKNKLNYNLTFVRPGFIVSPEQKPSFAGIGILLPLNFALLLGNKRTSLPLIEKMRFQEAMVKIACTNCPNPVYLLLENIKGTKYDFLHSRTKRIIVSMPRMLVMLSASLAKRLTILSSTQYQQVKGLFKNTYYDSSETECNLKFSLLKNSLCVIGAGTYGSYTINVLSEKYPDTPITLFDVGDSIIKSEEEIGFKSNLLNAAYTGLTKGRFFGLGGSSAKWGGQLLAFTKNDFLSPSPYLADIIKINEKYRDRIFKRFGVENKFIENHIADGLFTKTGIWLSYFNRNLFNYFKISKRKNVRIIENARINLIITEGQKVLEIHYLRNGVNRRAVFEHFFLTSGAFESNRILLNSGLTKDNKCVFSDHLSQKVFKIKGNTIIGKEDYAFCIRGASLITKRMIGEIEGVSFFANPIYNSEFPFFQNLKLVLFKHEINLSILKAILADLPSVFAFTWTMLVKKKVYVYKKEWYLYIDIENPDTSSFISLAKDKDLFDEAAIDVSFTINDKAAVVFENAKAIVKNYLVTNKVVFEECSDKIHVEKSEDTYHPYGMMCDYDSAHCFFTNFQNMLVINTGVLPRAGGINITAVMFPLIEEYISEYLKL